MQVFVAYDHRGQSLRQVVLATLAAMQVTAIDLGSTGDLNDDFPDFAEQVAQRVAVEPTARGILMCGSGAGMAIAANKIAGIRAATADTVAIAKLIRSDDDVNVLALASTQLTDEEVPAIIEAFLTTAFDGGRHQRRINKITALEHHS